MQNLWPGPFMPFEYPGAKTYEAQRIIKMIPDHTFFAEPFCGAASIFFAKESANATWLNDIDAELINAYVMLRDRPAEFVEAIDALETSRLTYNALLRCKPRSDLKRAVRWMYLALNSNKNINLKPQFLKFNYAPKANKRKAVEAMVKVSRKLQGVKLTSLDFAKVIKAVPRGAFLFLDPPYSLGNSPSKTKMYLNKFTKQDHRRLAAVLKCRAANVKFMLLYRADPEAEAIFSSIPNIYKKTIRSKVKYGVVEDKRIMIKTRDNVEIMFTNYKV
ncbi:MAG: DNA adenine methylase [Candidatus Micrarchaeaceae archaeon]